MITLFYKLLARHRGWQEAYDYDNGQPLLVVWHPVRGIHFTGPDAWKWAVRS